MTRAMDDTVEYVQILAQRLGGCTPNCVALVMLLDLGMPVNYDGFEYLKAAVLLQYEDPMRDLANDIYPAIAAKYGEGINKELIDTSIRSTVKSAWSRTDIGIWRKLLPSVLRGKNKAPTNAEVIASLARILELWYECADAYSCQRDREVVSCGTK